MDGGRRHAQNTGRMDAARGGGVCRRFLSGSCRYGQRCNFRHDRTVVPSTPICRYFQKGGCWFGENCRYLHVLQPEVDAAVVGRRGSEPTVSSSSRVAYAPPDRRGSAPALPRAQVTSRQACSRSEVVVSVSNPQHSRWRQAADIAEEESQDAGTPLAASLESVQSPEVAQASDGKNEQETSSNDTTDGGAAAASSSQVKEDVAAYLQSRNVTCGICMEKVYEKVDPRNQVFGILPNCNHPFCLQCIMTWRKTKDLGPDVVKTCPQCRVRSPFYVPNQYWVEGQAKERVVAAFKKKFSRKSCIYYSRSCCPFGNDCLYQHKHERRRSFPYPTEDEDDYDGVDLFNLFIAMTLLGGDEDDDDDFDFPFYLSDTYGF